MQGTAITATRRGKVVTCDVDKWKIVKERPNYFRTHTYYRTPTPNLQVSTDQSDDDDDDDFDLPKAEALPPRHISLQRHPQEEEQGQETLPSQPVPAASPPIPPAGHAAPHGG